MVRLAHSKRLKSVVTLKREGELSAKRERRNIVKPNITYGFNLLSFDFRQKNIFCMNLKRANR